MCNLIKTIIDTKMIRQKSTSRQPVRTVSEAHATLAVIYDPIAVG
jgi:hypothetical protein